jgi:hypothetical protein
MISNLIRNELLKSMMIIGYIVSKISFIFLIFIIFDIIKTTPESVSIIFMNWDKNSIVRLCHQ